MITLFYIILNCPIILMPEYGEGLSAKGSIISKLFIQYG